METATYLDERAIVTLRAFKQLLLFTVTDVKDPAGGSGEAHPHHHLRHQPRFPVLICADTYF